MQRLICMILVTFIGLGCVRPTLAAEPSAQDPECVSFPSPEICDEIKSYVKYLDSLPSKPLNHGEKAALERRHRQMVKLLFAERYDGTPCDRKAWNLQAAASRFYTCYSRILTMFENDDWKYQRGALDEWSAKLQKARSELMNFCPASISRSVGR